MNPAVATATSWTFPMGSSIRRVATSTAFRSVTMGTMTRTATSGLRSYATRLGAGTPRQSCTNTLRKTLYASSSSSRPLAISPSPITTTRLAPIVRRGFASAVNSDKLTPPAPKKSGFMDKIKQLVKQYGYTGVAVYLGISTLDLAATFVIVKAAGMEKIQKAQDYVLEHYGPYVGYKAKPKDTNKTATGATTAEDLDKVDDEQVGAIYNSASGLWSVFVIAYGIHKLLVPLRVVLTSMITPPLVKYLVKKGWIKEVAKATAGSAATKSATSAAAASASSPKP
ncbi:hypothetical protein FBU30_007915 [Linnemannia zychae]|nr:hypothetical protein FBU30_007915 [Linnemannia zychae]